MPTAVPIAREFHSIALTKPEALVDEELMRLLGASEDPGQSDDLFGEVFRRYHPRVTSWCFRFTRNRGYALDLAQEVFLKAYRHIHHFRGDSKLSTWLYAITRNHCLSAIRKMAADPVDNGECMPPRLRDHTTIAADRRIERDQLNRRVWQMFASTLEPMEARVMTLHYGYEIPLATITTRLALSNPSGAKAYVVNARRKLSGMVRRRGLNSSLLASSRMPRRTAA